MCFKNATITFLILFGIWLLLTNTVELSMVLTGAAVSLLIVFLFSRKPALFSGLRLTPKAFIYTILYIIVFLWELIKSNLDVARRVISPKLPIHPGIVKVKTTLTSPMGRLILANSITLTPGTFTVDIREEYLFIHWIDVTTHTGIDPTEAIVRKFEKYLEVIYG